MPVGYFLRKQRHACFSEYFFVTRRTCAKYIKYIEIYFKGGFVLMFNKVQAMYVFGC